MSSNETIPRISQGDWDSAEELVKEGYSPEDVRELVAGDNKEVFVDNVEQPVVALGRTGVRQAMKNGHEPELIQETFPSPYENGRRA